MSGVELPAVIVASPSLVPKTGLSVDSFSTVEPGRRLSSRVRPRNGVDEVVEEAAVVGSCHVLVAGSGKFVLVLALDAEFLGSDRSVVTHRLAGARLAVARNLQAEHARTDVAEQLDAVARGLRAIEGEQELARLIVDANRGVGRGVRAAADARIDAAGRNGVADGDDRLQSRATRLLKVVRRRVRGSARCENGLANEIEITAVLEHRTADDHAELLALQIESAHQTVERRSEHVLVGRLCVRLVRACERNAISADDRNRTALTCRICSGCGRCSARCGGLCI